MPDVTVLERSEVYRVINGERDYQEQGFGNAQRHSNQSKYMTPGEYILCMEELLEQARAAWYKPNGGVACLDYVRKIAATAVQCMEVHGAPER